MVPSPSEQTHLARTEIAKIVAVLRTPALARLIISGRLLLDDTRRNEPTRRTGASGTRAIGSSQARVAKMEGGDPQASIESLVRALAALGAKPRLKVA